MGVALAATRLRTSVPLVVLALAAQLPDWVDAGLCLGGYPALAFSGLWSHSVLAVAIAAGAAALAYALSTRDAPGAAAVALMVLAHLPADYFTGIKPTWPGGPFVGLALYRRPEWDFVLELGVLVAGWLAYRSTLPANARRSRALWAMLAALVAFQLLADVRFAAGPAPPKC